MPAETIDGLAEMLADFIERFSRSRLGGLFVVAILNKLSGNSL
jgi:hypothetical protein